MIGLCISQLSLSQELQIKTIGFPPYGIEDSSESKGIYYEAAELLAMQAGYVTDNVITPYARIISALKSGKADMTIMFKYSELDEHVQYVAAMPSLRVVVIGLAGSNYQSIEALEGKTIAYLRGAHFSEEIDADEKIFRQVVNDFPQAVKMLLAKHVDAIIGPMDPILSAAANMRLPESVFGVPHVVSTRTPWIQVSNKSLGEVSVEKLRTAFQILDDKGAFKALRKKYLKVKVMEE